MRGDRASYSNKIHTTYSFMEATCFSQTETETESVGDAGETAGVIGVIGVIDVIGLTRLTVGDAVDDIGDGGEGIFRDFDLANAAGNSSCHFAVGGQKSRIVRPNSKAAGIRYRINSKIIPAKYEAATIIPIPRWHITDVTIMKPTFNVTVRLC
jgi:hypothetical protein